MPHVLLRVFPQPQRKGVRGVQKAIELEDGEVYNDNDLFRIKELGELKVEKRPSETPEGFDYALHFVLRPEMMGRLSPVQGWEQIAGACAGCERE